MGRFFTKCARGDIWVLAATSDAELLGLAEIISAASVDVNGDGANLDSMQISK
uniref:Uncharacterized protein n=1 Tax=Oryza nivara TaxID=4536 RepID=A0A0E0IXG3_ORYNI